MKLSSHFHDTELISPILLKTIYDNKALPEWYITNYQLTFLESIRKYYNKSIYVNIPNANLFKRGICSDAESTAEGRNISSQHNRNGAFDITIDKILPEEFGNLVRENYSMYKIGGLGVNSKQNFCHIDWRNAINLVEWSY